MKKTIICLAAAFLSLAFMPTEAKAANDPARTESTVISNAPVISPGSVDESVSNTSALSKDESKGVTTTRNAAKSEASKAPGGVIYISVGALILIIILLIILL